MSQISITQYFCSWPACKDAWCVLFSIVLLCFVVLSCPDKAGWDGLSKEKERKGRIHSITMDISLLSLFLTLIFILSLSTLFRHVPSIFISFLISLFNFFFNIFNSVFQPYTLPSFYFRLSQDKSVPAFPLSSDVSLNNDYTARFYMRITCSDGKPGYLVPSTQSLYWLYFEFY